MSLSLLYIGADHRGYELKEKLETYLQELGHDVEDCGAFEYDKDDDYPDFAKAVAEKVVANQGSKGILICGSGIGVAIAANKVRGILAGTATSVEQISSAEGDEGLNVLGLSSDYVSEKTNKDIAEAFVDSKFSGAERHLRRVQKIKEIENSQ